jgi:hypothetical protein
MVIHSVEPESIAKGNPACVIPKNQRGWPVADEVDARARIFPVFEGPIMHPEERILPARKYGTS